MNSDAEKRRIIGIFVIWVIWAVAVIVGYLILFAS
jgi:hypothetical protein